MSQTIDSYIEENGVKPVFEFLSQFKENKVEFHVFAEENDIEMDSWFEFGWMINDLLSPRRGDVLPLVNFNYIAIENETTDIIESESPIEWDNLVTQVAANVENATVTDVAEWLQFFEIETMEDNPELVTEANFD
jgi:hypothetical protein